MTEVNTPGYERVRQLVNSSLTAPSQWDYIEIQDDTGTKVTRVSITGDSRASWNTAATDQTQTVQITLSAGDADVTTPVTVAESILKDTDTDAADELHNETFAGATLSETGDQVTITHNVEVPQV